MTKRCKIDRKTLSKIIHEDFGKKVRKKRLVHGLKDSHKGNRKRNCRKLYEHHLAGGKAEFMVSLDEALFYLQDCNGTRRIAYTKDPEEMEKFVAPKAEKFNDKFMVVGAICGRGTLPLMKFPSNAKINARYHVEHVLKPLLETHVLSLYGEEASKVYVHHDAATSHTARLTAAYAEDLKQRLGITILKKEGIPIKSPDASPMEFFGFGFLKQKLFRRKATTLQGAWKVLNDEWSKLPQETIENVMES